MADMLATVPSANPTHKDYDEVPYESHPFAQTHPERLFTVGTLFGMRPTPVQKCRVLELGCAAGGNLIPMADYLPGSEFIGVDLSEKQIAEGAALVKQFGQKNLTLKHASITDVTPDYGQFDYIICHGVFSWVPDNVRDKILAIAQRQLTPNGILYVSYNTYPGWHMRGMIRDMMRFHSNRKFAAPNDLRDAAGPRPARLPVPERPPAPTAALYSVPSSRAELEAVRHPGGPLPVPRAPRRGEQQPAVLPRVRRAAPRGPRPAVPGRGPRSAPW